MEATVASIENSWSAVPEILGGWIPDSMQLAKNQMLLTIAIIRHFQVLEDSEK